MALATQWKKKRRRAVELAISLVEMHTVTWGDGNQQSLPLLLLLDYLVQTSLAELASVLRGEPCEASPVSRYRFRAVARPERI